MQEKLAAIVLARAEINADLDAWERILETLAPAVGQLGGRKVVAEELGMDERQLGNKLRESGDHRLRAEHLLWIARRVPAVARAVAREVGLELRSVPDEPSEIERLEQGIVEEFGAAGAKYVARARREREMRSALKHHK